ncbi:MAG: transglutaminase domain-containing protein [Planctomycetota bacterium]|jgi:transglutaminase-like putative cysteine protease
MLPLILTLSLLSPAQDTDAGWTAFVADAEARHGEAGREAAAFLREHAPKADRELDAELLIANLDAALAARTEFPWAAKLPDPLFLNDVLPYAVLDETRENWRPAMLERARPIVAECETAEEAAQALNREIFNLVGVHYNTGRKRPNQSISESMAQGRATCTGLSVILVDACRAVGIPARAAGVANWHDERGNHTWVEIHDGERWRFTGADEYDSKGLDRGWFAGDASRATPGDPIFGVWASSWEPVDGHFTLVWARDDRSVDGVDVTARYLPDAPEPEASEPAADAAATTAMLKVRLWNTRGGERVEADLSLVANGERQAGRTRAGRRDLNDMPVLQLEPGVAATMTVEVGKSKRTTTVGSDAGETTLDLYWDELALSERDARRLITEHFEERAARIAEERAGELEAGVLRDGDHSLRLLTKTFGRKPKGGRSLWISMHGGGGAPAEVNDGQWQNQIRLYDLKEGLYVAPRAPVDAWNMWHVGQVDTLFDRLIETYVATGEVDPDRVYLLGYSAGGDGVYQLAPRMADRFAAASMMAGHPNDASPLGLRNLPFAIFMGGEDGAYDRNKIAARWGETLDALEKEDPDGYVHRCTIYEGLGHWMDGKDAEGLPWMAKYTRDPWPERVVWRQSGRTHDRFYWLATDAPAAGSTVTATVDRQRITIETGGVTSLRLRLHDDLIDLDRAIEVTLNGELAFEGVVPRTEAAIRRSLEQRCDPSSAASAVLELEVGS